MTPACSYQGAYIPHSIYSLTSIYSLLIGGNACLGIEQIHVIMHDNVYFIHRYR